MGNFVVADVDGDMSHRTSARTARKEHQIALFQFGLGDLFARSILRGGGARDGFAAGFIDVLCISGTIKAVRSCRAPDIPLAEQGIGLGTDIGEEIAVRGRCGSRLLDIIPVDVADLSVYLDLVPLAALGCREYRARHALLHHRAHTAGRRGLLSDIDICCCSDFGGHSAGRQHHDQHDCRDCKFEVFAMRHFPDSSFL